MANQATELRYVVRIGVIGKYFGQLCLVLAALTLVPLALSLVFGETPISLRYGIVIGGLATLGGILVRLPTPERVQTNEGMALVALMFLFTPLVMSYPMMGSGLGFQDAFFEAVSGVTTTGLTTQATLAGASSTFLFSRAWMQWYGGLGIVALSLAFVMQTGLVAKGLAVTETETDDLVGGTRAHARRVLKTYLALTAIGVVVCLLAGVGLFQAALYTLAAVSTGGFAPLDDSLASLSGFVQAWITLLCICGAIPPSLYRQIWDKTRRATGDVLQLQVLLVAGFVVSLAVGGSLWLNTDLGWRQILHQAPLVAFSAQTTAGFSPVPLTQFDAGSKVILMFSMLVGGSAGSTAGGFKLMRLLIAASVLVTIIRRTCLPKHAVIEPRLAGRRLQEQEIQAALLLILLFGAAVVLSWLPFVAMGYDPLDSLFEVVSATGTVGLSVGITSETLPGLLKGVLCADMLIGRLEVMAWLVVLYPGAWFGQKMEGA